MQTIQLSAAEISQLRTALLSAMGETLRTEIRHLKSGNAEMALIYSREYLAQINLLTKLKA